MESWIVSQLQKEWHVVQGAPIIFGFTWLLGLLLIWWTLDKYVYRSRLELKDDLIRSYKEKLGLVSDKGATSGAAREKAKKVETLAAFIGEGQEIRFRCPWPSGTEGDKAWTEEWNIWASKVDEFLGKELSPKAQTRFRHVAGINESFGIGSSATSRSPFADRQLQSLVDIMENLDA